jgi:hypothetical protein
LPGSKNIVADALSRLDLNENLEDNQIHELLTIEEDEIPSTAYPLDYNLLYAEQREEISLMAKKGTPGFALKAFDGGGKRTDLVSHNDRIVVPTSLRRKRVNWYHNQLCHPGINRTEQTIRQQFTWPRLSKHVQEACSRYDTCQLTKKAKKKYGKLPAKEAEIEPWDVLCVDLIGPYNIERKGKKTLILHAVTMIDPATGWFEVKQIPNKRADTIANIVETTWLTRYPRPSKCITDRGTECMAEFAAMIKDDYGITLRKITTRNPQVNAILERIHQTIGNILRSFRVQDNEVDENDPWTGILAATMFATRATVHTTLNATPMQLVFGRDAILNLKFVANWANIKERKQNAINKNNEKENKNRIDHTYEVGDQVLIKNAQNTKFGNDPYLGPYQVIRVNDNGTLRITRGATADVINIRNVHPYQV